MADKTAKMAFVNFMYPPLCCIELLKQVKVIGHANRVSNGVMITAPNVVRPFNILSNASHVSKKKKVKRDEESPSYVDRTTKICKNKDAFK